MADLSGTSRSGGGRAFDLRPRRRVITRAGMTAAAGVALLLAGATAPARAQSFELVMQGVLDGRSSLISGSTTTPLADGSAFTIQAFFDPRSPNLAAPVGVPGFVAYTPSLVQLTLGGRTYSMEPFDALGPTGVSVAIFDGTTPFGPPGHYAVGLIQDPLADGAGIVPDYTGATPAFSLGSGGVVPATFTGYFGVGVQGGACVAGGGADCQQYAMTPIPMTWAGQSFSLLLGNYDEDATASGPTFTASLQAVPEPGALALSAAGLVGVAAVARRRRRA
ncbi:hypothetical protein tb265_16550 [Gemmatimonadetes bacterium T265]|nr:hypothetical protein tb265_16550 [Gemmatimonadetes bacterium T265]